MWSAGTKPKASSPQLLEISWLTLITQTSGFSCRHSHVSLPQRNRRQKRPCTNVFNLLQSWNVGGKSSRPLMLYTEWSGWQVLYQICLLPHLLPQFFSLLALNNLTFKSLKILLWVSCIFILFPKFIFSLNFSPSATDLSRADLLLLFWCTTWTTHYPFKTPSDNRYN